MGRKLSIFKSEMMLKIWIFLGVLAVFSAQTQTLEVTDVENINGRMPEETIEAFKVISRLFLKKFENKRELAQNIANFAEDHFPELKWSVIIFENPAGAYEVDADQILRFYIGDTFFFIFGV
ncbi:unnamed protein product [Caenorhabditis angaria]|uniref:Uncharacterized protein n=1 Tax=Caenorhabditis angaria TaxID=860376 RepID=A0A9P1IIM0_9PELO|nr:unnamed protein product [Caenorhabditis angaria]